MKWGFLMRRCFGNPGFSAILVTWPELFAHRIRALTQIVRSNLQLNLVISSILSMSVFQVWNWVPSW